MTSTMSARAVVLGASMAGLVAARVLAESFAEVIVIDRDDLGPDFDRGPRRGVPQGRHIHALLPRGQQALEMLFPGLTDELVGAGASVGDLLANSLLNFGGHRFCRGVSGLTVVCLSRPLLESTVRRRVMDLPCVRVRDACDVVGLSFDRRGARVLGVRVVGRAEGNVEETLAADLVVDATGRGSRLPIWFASNGWPPPRKEQVWVGLGYASRRYRVPPEVMGDTISMMSAPTPQNPRGGALALIEDGQCLVTLVGILGDHPPLDPEGFHEFASHLTLPELSEVLQIAEPVDEPVAFRYPTVVRHRYDALRRFPEGLAVIGDSVCSLSPVYGQGMTVAALQALALGRRLKGRNALRPRDHLRDLGKIAGNAWALALGADLAFPEIEGPRTPCTWLMGRYIDRVQAAAERDPQMGSAFAHVAGLVDPPHALFRPRVVIGAMLTPRCVVSVKERHAGSR